MVRPAQAQDIRGFRPHQHLNGIGGRMRSEFTIYDLRFSIEGLQAGLTLNT